MPKQINPGVLLGEILHEWNLQEYDQYERGSRWYILMIILGIILVLYGIFSGNFLFSLIIILFAIIIFLQSHQKPLKVPFKITELGVVVGNRFYGFPELDSFYIIYEPPEVKMLFLETKSTVRPLLRIPLSKTNPLEVRECLRDFLNEDIEKEDEPYSDKFARNWKLH